MPDEHGKPMAGEWWETRGGDRACVVASLDNQTLIKSGENCQLVGWAIHRCLIECTSWSRAGRWVSGQTFDRDLVKHLPDCTGWDWQAPDWVELTPEEYGWHVLRRYVDHVKSDMMESMQPVLGYTGMRIAELQASTKGYCLRKDLPQKPPEPAITSGGPYVSIEVHQAVIAERDALRARMREIEAKAKFYESVM